MASRGAVIVPEIEALALVPGRGFLFWPPQLATSFMVRRMDRTDNKQLADNAVQTLERARNLHSTAALRDLNTLREKIGNGAGVENERAAAWLAISALCNTLLESPQAPDVEACWQRAIDQTAAWLATLI
jgi:hypothetical protein